MVFAVALAIGMDVNSKSTAFCPLTRIPATQSISTNSNCLINISASTFISSIPFCRVIRKISSSCAYLQVKTSNGIPNLLFTAIDFVLMATVP